MSFWSPWPTNRPPTSMRRTVIPSFMALPSEIGLPSAFTRCAAEVAPQVRRLRTVWTFDETDCAARRPHLAPGARARGARVVARADARPDAPARAPAARPGAVDRSRGRDGVPAAARPARAQGPDRPRHRCVRSA